MEAENADDPIIFYITPTFSSQAERYLFVLRVFLGGLLIVHLLYF